MGSFPGLNSTMVVIDTTPKVVEIDPNRRFIGINLETGEIKQSKPDSKDPPPKGFTNFRSLPEKEFERILKQLKEKGTPGDLIEGLRKYRA